MRGTGCQYKYTWQGFPDEVDRLGVSLSEEVDDGETSDWGIFEQYDRWIGDKSWTKSAREGRIPECFTAFDRRFRLFPWWILECVFWTGE